MLRMRSSTMTVLGGALFLVAGCGGKQAPLPGAESGGAPPQGGLSKEAAIAVPGAEPSGSHPGPGSSSPSAVAVEIETGVPIPLKMTGIGSKQELDHALAGLDDPQARARFEEGFRLCFSNDRSLRRFVDAVPAMEEVLAKKPGFAPAYRVLAYAHFNINFDMEKATDYYEKAVATDPNYGEAHYALAFMLTQSDTSRARVHFDRAMALGVPDERNLKEQFFK